MDRTRNLELGEADDSECLLVKFGAQGLSAVPIRLGRGRLAAAKLAGEALQPVACSKSAFCACVGACVGTGQSVTCPTDRGRHQSFYIVTCAS